MLKPKNIKLEWVLMALFGIGSVAFLLVALAYVSNQGNQIAPEPTGREITEDSPSAVKQAQKQQEADAQPDDAQEKRLAEAGLKGDKVVAFSLKSQEIAALPEASGAPETKIEIDEPIESDGRIDPDKPIETDQAPKPGEPAETDNPSVIGDGDEEPLPPADPDGEEDPPPVPEPSKEDTFLSYTGETISQRNSTAILQAELLETEAPAGDLSGNKVIFTLSDGARTQVATAITDADGQAEVSTLVSLPAGPYELQADFAGGSHLAGSSTDVPFVIWEAIDGLNVSGRGWLTDDSEKVSFGFSAKYAKDSEVPLGQLQLVDRSGESDLNIRTEGFNWLVVSSDNLAFLQGQASVNGVSGYSFELLVSDNGTPGKGKDFFELSIYGLTIVSGFIDGGNIAVH